MSRFFRNKEIKLIADQIQFYLKFTLKSAFNVQLVFFIFLQYKALAISYPKDKANIKAQIDADEQATVSS